MKRSGLSRAGALAALAAAAHMIWCVLVPVHTRGLRLVDVRAGMSVSEIASHLGKEGVIRCPLYLHAFARLRGRPLKAGEYGFRGECLLTVLARLEKGRVYLHEVLVPEGVTVAWMADELARKGLVSREEFLKAARDRGRLKELGITARSAEGYLFPDTYKVPRGITASSLVSIMTAHFFENLPDEFLKLAAGKELSLHGLVTLASIVEKEAEVAEERALISGVFHRRLKQGMLLQADPTVRYALKKWDRHITLRDIGVDSPYNTYRYRGLPPGPICSPGRAALEAAARPAKVPYLYFVARWDGTGRHDFSRTNEEHERAKLAAQARARKAGM